MESKTTPYFVFLWVASKGENTSEKNELMRRIDQYTSTMTLLHKDSPADHEFHLVLNLADLIKRLRPVHNHLPVFVLIGHGYAETGSMVMWDETNLNPTTLLSRWQCTFKCDIIATACGANAFVSPMQYPILLYYNRACRFLAAAEPLAELSHVYTSEDGVQRHLELTQLMMHYLRVHDNGCSPDAVQKAEAFVKKNRQTAKQQRLAKERAEAAERNSAEMKKRYDEMKLQWNKWATDRVDAMKTQWNAWAQQKEQHCSHTVALERWRSRWFFVFCVFVFLQFLDVLVNRGPVIAYALFDLVLYYVLLR